MPLKPAIKGLITACGMIAIALGTYYGGLPPNSPLQYGVFILYGIGVVWTLLAYRRSPQFTGKFSDTFNQGFRCFIVVTLLMVAFTGIFSKMHPEFAEESSKLYRQDLVEKKELPTEIDTKVATYRKNYTLTLVYGSIFTYLIIGVGVTACLALLLKPRY